MAKDFFERLREYYVKVGEVLKGNAETSSIFPNSTDKGQSRERVYAEFKRTHAPSKCNTFFGGFLFDKNGFESKQMDLIVNTDTTPQYNFSNADLNGKSFSPIEGTLAAISVKSNLDKKQLIEALENIASIPQMDSLEGRISFTIQISNYDEWPLKVIYASDGLELQTILNHVNQFYIDNAEIPLNRRPNIIHVAGKYVLIKVQENAKFKNSQTGDIISPAKGTFMASTESVDIQGLGFVINEIQSKANASNEITFNYGWIMNKMLRTE